MRSLVNHNPNPNPNPNPSPSSGPNPNPTSTQLVDTHAAVRRSLRGGNAGSLVPEELDDAFADAEPTVEALEDTARQALEGVGVEPAAAKAQAAELAPEMLVEDRRTRARAAAEGAPGEGVAAATDGGSTKRTLKALEDAAALQSKRPLSSIKDRTQLLAAAKTKAKMLTDVLHALKVKVQQVEAADARMLEARSAIADQRGYVKELEQQLEQLQPMVEDLQQRLGVFDAAAELLLNAGLWDFPYEFAEALVEGDMHEACILCRRLSAACRNVRVPSQCHRWVDTKCRNHLIFAASQHSARAAVRYGHAQYLPPLPASKCETTVWQGADRPEGAGSKPPLHGRAHAVGVCAEVRTAFIASIASIARRSAPWLPRLQRLRLCHHALPRRAEYKRDGAGKVGINSVNIKEFAQRMELEQQACPKQTRALALALALWPDYTSVISLERLLAAGVC